MALTHVKYASSPRQINLQYAIPDSLDGKTGIFFSLEKSGLSSCAGGKLQRDFFFSVQSLHFTEGSFEPFPASRTPSSSWHQGLL